MNGALRLLQEWRDCTNDSGHCDLGSDPQGNTLVARTDACLARAQPQGESAIGQPSVRSDNALLKQQAGQHFQHCPSVIIDLQRERDELRAKLDALMLEYCPEHMTAEQIVEWSKHQAPE